LEGQSVVLIFDQKANFYHNFSLYLSNVNGVKL
jgi:hypothetical protein